MSFTAYAKRRGVSVEAVSKAVESERLTVLVCPKGVRWLDPERADREWAENSDPSKVIGGEAAAAAARDELAKGSLRKFSQETSEETLDDEEDEEKKTVVAYHVSRARKEAANAELAELNLNARRGTLVESDKVKAEAFRVARTVRESVLGIPDRIAASLAAETDTSRVHLALTRELRQALEELAADG
jgi:phage terminase Nu1 subunit (DNA packaging protein)